MANQNTPEYLDKIKTRLFENLRMLPHAPGVQMHAIPEDAINEDSEDEDKSNPDERISIRASDKRIAPDNEYSDSEDEGDRRDQKSFKGNRKRPRTETAEGSTPAEVKKEDKEDKDTNGDSKEALMKDVGSKEPEKKGEAAASAEPSPDGAHADSAIEEGKDETKLPPNEPANSADPTPAEGGGSKQGDKA